ncbi:tRNA1(Val) (adenine(37)-N6)-methyltransferase [Compostibacter hankyongensis]|uniref:tRNA1(Val) (adenine(37)-N6)-methyltransferase n=1 Tax=Compostibacter hankyongensis TaxID=1007089 RepID=A0ABP8FLE2_9BACT
MSNTYFQFKQFRIGQEHCAMKVCTDACIQGAYTAAALQKATLPVGRALDIGTGTGLLSLMLAQQLPGAIFDAIELDEAASRQAQENARHSPWPDRINVRHGDARTFLYPQPYDLIICNPPFYGQDLKSGDERINRARHAVELDFSGLLAIADRWLKKEGLLGIMLPGHRFAAFATLAAGRGLFPERLLQVRQTPRHDFFRSIALFSCQPRENLMEELTIMNGNAYTPECAALLQPYYLYL